MKEANVNIEALLSEIDSLKNQLFDANNIIDAIREGSIDALVLHDNGTPQIYSIESADYTYRILIEKFGEGALSMTETGLILYCNDAFSKLIGLPASKIVGSYFSSYIDPSEEKKHLQAAMENGSSKGEVNLLGNGMEVPVYVSFTDLHPNVSAIGVVVTDLSEKKKHELELIEHQKELELKIIELNSTNSNLEQFIHVISHDLKEPLRKILMYTSILDTAKENTLNREESNAVEVVQSSALRLNSLVDDLVKYAFSAVKEDVEEICLNEVLQEVTEDLELMIREKNAVIHSDQLPVIPCSKVQMRQLFSNLISNAIKYSKKDIQPELKIICSNAGNFYKISLQDNGIGMDQAHLGKIFTIFQRLHMRNEYSGNGIGLAICKKIMENHSGTIEVESKLNEGSIFNLYFPVKI